MIDPIRFIMNMMSFMTNRISLAPKSNFEMLDMNAAEVLSAGIEDLTITDTSSGMIDNVALMMLEDKHLALATPDPEELSLKNLSTMAVRKAMPPLSPKLGNEVSSKKVHEAKDSMDPSFHVTLYSGEDKGKLDTAHVVIPRDVLEVRHATSGKVYLQCAFCKHLPRSERVRCSTAAPRRVESIYRSVANFRIKHVAECSHVPHEIKAMSPEAFAKAAKYSINWVEGARALGLVNGPDGGVIFCPDAAY